MLLVPDLPSCIPLWNAGTLVWDEKHDSAWTQLFTIQRGHSVLLFAAACDARDVRFIFRRSFLSSWIQTEDPNCDNF